jgi:HSP20 family molecular chaperone IbpA
MWSEALSLMERADQLHRQFFRPAAAAVPTWEPPVDVMENADAIQVQVALPGVKADSVTVTLEPQAITISARRPFPLESSAERTETHIHALEIPYGRFQRRIGLPADSLVLTGRQLQDGCLTLIFSRKESP